MVIVIARKLDCPVRRLFRLDDLRAEFAKRGAHVPYEDLAEILHDRAGQVRLLGLHYAFDDRKDNINAHHIAHCQGVHVIAHKSDSHAFLAGTLAEQGVINHHLATPLEQLEQDCCRAGPAAVRTSGLTRHAA